MNRRPRITAADPTCLFRSAVSVALHLDQVLFILVGNLQTLNSYMEFCFPGRTHAAIHGPDESRRAQQGGGTMIPCQGLGSLYHSVPLDSEGWHSVSRARGWVLAEQASIARGSRVWVRLTCLCRGTPRAARSSLASPTPRDDPCWCDDSISIHSTSRAFSDGFLRSSESGFRSVARLISQAHSTRSLVVAAAEDIEGSRKETLGASSGPRRR